jgi:predicted nucleic acid-binding Zn ribbon protein
MKYPTAPFGQEDCIVCGALYWPEHGEDYWCSDRCREEEKAEEARQERRCEAESYGAQASLYPDSRGCW